MELRRFLVILSIALVILLIIAVWFFPSDEDFRVENSFWNGTSDISASYPILPVQSLSDLPPSPQGSTLILIPYRNCNPAELGQLNDFITRGGRLILADDYGHGNQILEYLGLKARFSQQTLLDPLTNYKNKYFPRIIHLEPGPLTSNIESLVLNHATSLVNVAATNILALSSSFSFLDRDGSGKWEDGEATGPLPVISLHNLGSGQVILIADPSLFINSMEKMEGNDSFIRNIAATTTGSIFIDQSHLPPSDLHQARNLLVKIRGFLANAWTTSGLVILALIITLKPVWHQRKEGSGET